MKSKVLIKTQTYMVRHDTMLRLLSLSPPLPLPLPLSLPLPEYHYHYPGTPLPLPMTSTKRDASTNTTTTTTTIPLPLSTRPMTTNPTTTTPDHHGTPPYGLFFSARQNGHTFPQKKPVNVVTINTANGHILKSRTLESLIISPVNTVTCSKFKCL